MEKQIGSNPKTTLDEAIKTLTVLSQDINPGVLRDNIRAVKLGTEAMKRLKILRKYPRQSSKWQLPGETEKEVKDG